MFFQLYERLGWAKLMPKISAKKMSGCVVLVALFFQYALVLDCTQILRIVEVVLGSTQFTWLEPVH